MDSISYINLGNGNHPIDAVTVNGMNLTSMASYYNPANETLYFFKSVEDRNSFVADKTKTNLILFSSEVSNYIEFKDPNVKSVMVSNFGDGTGVTYARAKRQLSMSSVFTDNSNISVFDEFKYFTGTTSMFEAFKNSSIKKITLPKGVTWTNNGSAFGLIFYGCTQLQEIDFADFTRSSASFAGQFQVFSSCSSLTTLHFDSIEQINNLQKTAYTLSDVPFGYNNGAHKVYVQNDMYEDELLTNLVIPETITTIRTAAFYRFNCITSLTIPNTVTSIGNYAFYQCTGLTSLTIPSSVTSIGTNAFDGCSNLTGDFTIPETVTNLGVQSFQSCTKLGNVTVNASVMAMQISVFSGAFNNSTSVLTVNCPITKNNSGYSFGRVVGVIINNSYSGTYTSGAGSIVASGICKYVRISGNISNVATGCYVFHSTNNNVPMEFLEIGGTIDTNTRLFYGNYQSDLTNGCIVHLGKSDGIAGTVASCCASYSRISKIYVGPGESQAGDQAILNLYLADTSWAQYASKLDLWYNYSGVYKN